MDTGAPAEGTGAPVEGTEGVTPPAEGTPAEGTESGDDIFGTSTRTLTERAKVGWFVSSMARCV
jgi:hypothetical protein